VAIQYSVTHRTNAMTQLSTDIGATAVIKIFTGTAPTNCGTADTGTLLVTFAGPATSFTNTPGSVSSGVLTAGTVASATAAGTGTAGYFRIYPTSATTTNAVVQGTCGTSGTDMILTNTSIASGQTVNFTSLTVTAFGV
jgi:hypothetical protein